MIIDRKMDPSGKTSWKCVEMSIGTTATSQTGKRTDAVTPGFPFQVMAVEGYALTVTTTMAFDVQIGSTSVLSSTITPTADALVAGTLSGTLANLQGSSTAVLSLKYTSGGSGAATNGRVRVWIRARPLNGDAAP